MSLKKFKPQLISTFVDKDVEYFLYYEPSLGLLRAEPQGEHSDLPEFAMSLKTMLSVQEGFVPPSKMDIGGRLTAKIYKEWLSMSKKDRALFTDSLPLNALYLGGDSIH